MSKRSHGPQIKVLAATMYRNEKWLLWHFKLECGHFEKRKVTRKNEHLIDYPQRWVKCNTCAKAREEREHENGTQQE